MASVFPAPAGTLQLATCDVSAFSLVPDKAWERVCTLVSFVVGGVSGGVRGETVPSRGRMELLL